MIETIKEAALDYINSERECNLVAARHNLTLKVGSLMVDVETVWYQKQEDKVYLHCGCKEFEGDIDVESLSDENQERLREVLACEDITDEDVPRLMQMHEGKPLVFLFRVADVDREEVNRGMSREECFKRCAKFYTLDELGDAWNDTDDNMRCLMDVMRSWCYVSQPEKPDEERRKKRERLTKETIVLLAADIYQTIYDRDECDGWGDACDDIIRYAEQFEKELDWQEDDERDYMVELEKFEKKVLDELNK